MCGRYTQITGDDCIAAFEPQERLGQPARPRYNIAPTQLAPAILLNPQHRTACIDAHWGLALPSGRASLNPSPLINARSETVATKPAFRAAYCTSRCLVPADGFYEWTTPSRAPRTRLPILFQRADRLPFAFAGLWQANPAQPGLIRFAILTMPANNLIQPIHHRMPLILTPLTAAQWLEHPDPLADPAFNTPFPADQMRSALANPRLNSARVDDPQCLIPTASPAAPPSLPSLFD